MHMRAIAAAQDKLRASGAIDTNEDGEGEYGFFTELTGKAKLRVGPSAESSAVLAEPLLSTLFSRIVQRRASVAGYRFQMFLPGEKAAPQPEDNFGGGVAAKIESQLAEKAWCCIAW